MAKNQKLNAQIRVGATQDRSVGVAMGAVQRKLSGIGDEIKTVQRRQKEIADEREAFKKQGRSVEALDREYEELGETLTSLQRRQARWENALKRSRRVGAAFTDTMRSMRRAARTTSIVIGGASAAMFGVANSTANVGDEVAKTADRLGVGVEAFQELRFAAERSGIDDKKFKSSMESFVKRLGEAKEGTGEAAKALDTLGLSADELSEMGAEEALGVIAHRMREISDPALRNALTADLFSRGGLSMLNLLNQGSEGMRELMNEGREVGAVLTESTVRGSETFKDQLTNFQSTVGGLKNIIGSELMPVVGQAMEQFSTFMRDNREGVQEFASEFADGIERILPKIGSALENVQSFGEGIAGLIRPVGQAIAKVSDLVGGFDNLGTLVGGFFAAKFLGAAFASTPIGLAVMALAAAAAVIIANWDEIGDFFQRVWGSVASAMETAQARIGSVMDWIGEKFDWLWEKIEPVVSALTSLKDAGTSAVNSVGSLFRRNGPAEGTDPGGAHPFNRRAIGGAFSAGRGLIVGERGPEAMFPSQGGYIATNRAVENMAGMIERIREGTAGMMQQSQGAAQVTVNNSIDARGMNPRELLEVLEESRRQASQGALFDPPAGFGQYGGAM